MFVVLVSIVPAPITSMHVESVYVALVHAMSVCTVPVPIALESIASEHAVPVCIVLVPEK